MTIMQIAGLTLRVVFGVIMAMIAIGFLLLLAGAVAAFVGLM